MKNKKLQLDELKIKSYLTIVNKEEQRTAKGGILRYHDVVETVKIVNDTIGSNPWTSEKTRASGSDNLLNGTPLG